MPRPIRRLLECDHVMIDQVVKYDGFQLIENVHTKPSRASGGSVGSTTGNDAVVVIVVAVAAVVVAAVAVVVAVIAGSDSMGSASCGGGAIVPRARRPYPPRSRSE